MKDAKMVSKGEPEHSGNVVAAGWILIQPNELGNK